MTQGIERRVSNLETVVAERANVGFRGFISQLDSPLAAADRRLRIGVEPFEYVLPVGAVDYPGVEQRARGYISRWCEVSFGAGGNLRSWNRALKQLRTEKVYFSGDVVQGYVNFDKAGAVDESKDNLIRTVRRQRHGVDVNEKGKV